MTNVRKISYNSYNFFYIVYKWLENQGMFI